ILGGEFEAGLLQLGRRLARGEGGGAGQEGPVVSLERQEFLVPDRRRLPLLDSYAKVDLGDGQQRVAGYTEATRGCRHMCRHCPIVPVYGGRFRVVQADVVLADIRQQVRRGAQHITFGDPDFFNGPRHAIDIVTALHEEFPAVSYDATIKIEHLRKQFRLLPTLRDTGCLFVTSAVEAVDEATLERYEKNHTRQEFIDVTREFRRIGLSFNPTFVTFSPWTTLDSYADLLSLLIELELVDSVAPIQLAIRLLIPQASRLLELPEMHDMIAPFDEAALCYPWKHPDPKVDKLHADVLARVQEGTGAQQSRRAIFTDACRIVRNALPPGSPYRDSLSAERIGNAEVRAVPGMTEPWYCCAEPTEEQLLGAGIGQV
ncbi:MAG: radical SAM protein, partial [Streptosporangiaceae bacterium]